MVVFALAIAVTGRVYDAMVQVGHRRLQASSCVWARPDSLHDGLLAVPAGLRTARCHRVRRHLNSLLGALISRWFVARRGLAVSVAIAGFCLASSSWCRSLPWHPAFRVAHLLCTYGFDIPRSHSLLAFLVIKDGKPHPLGSGLVEPRQRELSSTDGLGNVDRPFAIWVCERL